jgi:CRP-like cAMP-binding protein
LPWLRPILYNYKGFRKESAWEGIVITIRQYGSGETIIREHDHGETAFVIEKGKVEVTRERDGKTVHIAFLEGGAAFGEMSMVDDSPRSATVTALEETLVREIHRNDIKANMKENPDAILKFLNIIFERLREANTRIAQLESTAERRPPVHASGPVAHPSIPATPASAAAPTRPQNTPPPPGEATAKPLLYSIEGMTPRAVETMADNPFKFTSFPLKIGRKTNDPLVNNHLEIIDQHPLQISRHHVSIVRENGKIGVIDRGSHLGALVDDVRIGGKKNGPGPAFFKGDEGILVLGTDASPFRYKIRIAAASF